MKFVLALRQLFFPPEKLSGDRSRIAHIVVVTSYACLIAFGIIVLIRIASGEVNHIWIMGLTCVMLFVSLALVRRMQILWAGAILTWSLLWFIGYMIWKSDGMHDTAFLAVPGILVLGSLVMEKRQFYLLASLTLVLVGVLGYSETSGFFVNRFSHGTTVFDTVDYLVILTVTAVTVRQVADLYMKSFAIVERSERELRENAGRLKASEDQLRKSEEYYRTLVETSPEAIVILDTAGRLIFASMKAYDMFRVPRDHTVTGKSVFDWVAPDDRAFVRSRLEAAMARAQLPPSQEYRLMRQDGSVVLADVAASALVDAEGRVNSLMLVCRDVSERRAAENALRESEERFARLSDASFEGIVVSRQGEVIDLNSRLAGMLGYTQTEMIGMDVSKFVAPESLDTVLSHIRSGNEEPYEHMAMRKDGSVFPVEVRSKHIRSNGETLRLTAIRDMTERRKMEEDLRVVWRSVEQSSASVVITDTTGTIQYVNPRFTEVSGYSAREAIGQNPRVLKSGLTSPAEYAALWAAITSGGVWRGVFCNKKKNGDLFWEEASISGVTNEKGVLTHFLAVKTDITDQKKTELALEESEKRYRDLVEHLPDGVYRSTHEGKFIEVNEAMVNILGYQSKEELLAIDIRSQLYFKPEDRESAALEEKLEEMAIFRLRKKDGSEVWVEDHGRHVVDAQGKVLHHEGILRDITARVQAELERKRLEDQLFQAQKMESIGTLAAGIAHDFNNILGIVRGNSELISISRGDKEKSDHLIDNVITATERGAQLVNQLMTFARKTAIVEQTIHVNELIRETADLIEATFPKSISVSLQLQPEVPPVTGDGNQLHQVLVNLCVNSRDAMPQGGVLRLTTDTVTGEHVRTRFPEAHHRQYVIITVKDTGHGMDESIHTRIFDPFFTTKGPDKGTGLGLAVVLGIVSKHHGFIDVRSSPGTGTEFYIYLPASEPLTKKSPQAEPIVPEGQHSGTLLLIDDESDVRESLTEFLRLHGYRLLIADDGDEGLRILKDHLSSVDMVITDLRMPRMDGLEVCRRAREMKPKIPLFVITAYFGEDAFFELLQVGVDAVLKKPYRLEEVLSKVQGILQEAKGK